MRGTNNTEMAKIGDWIIIPPEVNKAWCGRYQVIKNPYNINGFMATINHPTHGMGAFYIDEYTIDPVCKTKLWKALL